MPLEAVKSVVRQGGVYDVTNHYVTREDHPCHGTTRRRVTKVNSSSVYMVPAAAPADAEAKWPAFKWPKATQVEMDPDGTIRLYGGGAGQQPGELFLTLVPVQDQSQ
jgi:hypothetical protein